MRGGSFVEDSQFTPGDRGSIYKPRRWFNALSPRYLSFGFISPYMKLKDTELMKEEDLPEIPLKDDPFRLGRHLEESLRREERSAILGRREPSLMRALLRAYYPFIIICIFSLTVIDIIRFSVGFIIKRIVADLQKPMPLRDADKINSVVNFLMVFVIMVFSSISIPHIVFFQYRYIFRIYASLATNILWRGLKKSGGLLVRRSIEKNGLIPPYVMDMKLIEKIKGERPGSSGILGSLSSLLGGSVERKDSPLVEVEMKGSPENEREGGASPSVGGEDVFMAGNSHAIRLNYINIYNVMMGDLFPCSILLGNLISVILFPLRVLLASYAISMILKSSLPSRDNNLGWIVNVSLISCIATLTLFISISAIFQVRSGFLRKPLFYAKDCRLDELRYILSNIRTIKLLNWESFVYRNLVELRTYEMYWRGKRLWLSGFSEIFSFCSSYFSQAVLFTCFGMLFKKYFGQFSIPATATVPIIFSLNTLFTSVSMLPDELGYVVQGFVSLCRIQTFLFSRMYDYPLLKDREFATPWQDGKKRTVPCGVIKRGACSFNQEEVARLWEQEREVLERDFQRVALWYVNATFVRQIYDDPVYRYLHQLGYLRSCGGMDLVYKQLCDRRAEKEGESCVLDVENGGDTAESAARQEGGGCSHLVNMTTLTEIASFRKKSSFDRQNVEKILKYFEVAHMTSSLENWPSFDLDVGPESDFRMLGKLSPCLVNLNIKVDYGDLCFIVGDHGSGKTTFVDALLGDLFRIKGDTYLGTEICGEKGDVTERNVDIVNSNPWIPFGTFKEVILAGREYDSEVMECVVQVCQLVTDLKMWQLGYNHLIEEYGNNLSNGQRARVSLARSIYRSSSPGGGGSCDAAGARGRRRRLICMDSIFEHMDPNVTLSILSCLFSSGTLFREGEEKKKGPAVLKYDERVLDLVIPSRRREDHAVFITLNEPTLTYIIRRSGFQTDFKLRFFRISEMTIKELTSEELAEMVSRSADGLDSQSGTEGRLSDSLSFSFSSFVDIEEAGVEDSLRLPVHGQSRGDEDSAGSVEHSGDVGRSEDLEAIRQASAESGLHLSGGCSSSRRNSLSNPRICLGENGLLKAMEIEVSKLISRSGGSSVAMGMSADSDSVLRGGGRAISDEAPGIFDENFLELSGHVKLESYSWYLFGFFGKKNIISLLVLFMMLSLLICSIDTIVILWSGTDLDMRRDMILKKKFDHQTISSFGLKYMMIFIAVTVIASVTKVVTTYIEINSILKSAIVLHNKILFEMIISPLTFFDSLDSQSLVNIFSMDLGIIDGELNLGIILKFFSAMASQGFIIWSSPICLVIYPFLIWYYFKYIFKPTRIQTRESYRFLLNTYGPLCNKTECNIRGSSTIRNMGFQDHYKRDTSNILYILQRTFYYSYAIGIWRLIRTLFFGILLMFILFICPTISRILNFQLPLWITRFAHSFQSAILSSFLVLSLSIIIAFPNTITALITDFIDLEKNMCSVQRFQILEKQINHAIFVERNKSLSSIGTFSEANRSTSLDKTLSSPQAANPEDDDSHTRGLVINNIVMSYHNNSNVIFDHLFMSVQPGEHIGLIGRTGSGKSSLFQCILGNYKLDNGFISLDGVNIELTSNNYPPGHVQGNDDGVVAGFGAGIVSHLIDITPRQTYGHSAFEEHLREIHKSSVGRNRFIGYIPQNSIFINNWRVRDYIDPFREFSDEEIWKAVEDLRFEPLFKDLPKGLESVVYSDSYSEGVDKMMKGRRGGGRRVSAVLRSWSCGSSNAIGDNKDLGRRNEFNHINHRYLFSLSQLRLISLLRVYLNSSKYKLILVDEPPIIHNKENNSHQARKKEPKRASQNNVINIRFHQEKFRQASGNNRRQINIKFTNNSHCHDDDASSHYCRDHQDEDSRDGLNGGTQDDKGIDSTCNIPSISYLISKYFKHCIVIIIAHHMESIEFCDKVYIMGKGKIEKVIDLKETNNSDNLQNIFKLIQS